MSVDREGLQRFVALFSLGCLGIVAVLLDGVRRPDQFAEIAEQAGMTTDMVVLIAAAQLAVILAIAVLMGQYTAPKVGFTSHVVRYVSDGTPILEPIRRDGRHGLVLGGAIGGLLVIAEVIAPETIDEVDADMTVRLVVESIPLRVLYGGITEELLLRWGAMALIAFVLWRLLGSRGDSPTDAIVWTAIVLSAILFGLLHLPMATTIYGPITPELLTFIVGFNAIGGIAFGWLFWRHSLEAAMIAHTFAHVVAVTMWLLMHVVLL